MDYDLCIVVNCEEPQIDSPPYCYCRGHADDFLSQYPYATDFCPPHDWHKGDIIIPFQSGDSITYNLYNQNLEMSVDGGLFGLHLDDHIRERLAWALLGGFKNQ